MDKPLKEITQKITSLPTLPTVVTEITRLMQNPHTSTEQIA